MLPQYHARPEGVKTHPKTDVLKITLVKKIVEEAFFSHQGKPNGEKTGEFEYSPTAPNDLGQVR